MIKKILLCLIIITLCGCSHTDKYALDKAQQYVATAQSKNYKPCMRADGEKFKIEILDVDHYISTALFYYTFEKLQSYGWIDLDEKLPFSPEDVYTENMAEYFSQHCKNGCIDITNYYNMVTDSPEDYEKSIDSHIAENNVDILICIGTNAGITGKRISGGRVPVLVISSVDPVAAGITNDSDVSGIKNIWAMVASSGNVNQFRLYKSVFDFKNIGMVYVNESIAGIADYSKVTAKTNTKISSLKMDNNVSEAEDTEEYYSEYENKIMTLVNEYKIDAFMINSSMVTDEDKAEEICNMLHDMGIPVFGQMGDEFLQKGSPFMSVTFSPEDDAAFLVNAMTAVMNGKKPEEIIQKFDCPLHVSLNKKAADKLGIELDPDILEYADKIYY